MTRAFDRIAAGLADAIAFAGGDRQRAQSTTVDAATTTPPAHAAEQPPTHSRNSPNKL
jgi:hypothetical protein